VLGMTVPGRYLSLRTRLHLQKFAPPPTPSFSGACRPGLLETTAPDRLLHTEHTDMLLYSTVTALVGGRTGKRGVDLEQSFQKPAAAANEALPLRPRRAARQHFRLSMRSTGRERSSKFRLCANGRSGEKDRGRSGRGDVERRRVAVREIRQPGRSALKGWDAGRARPQGAP